MRRFSALIACGAMCAFPAASVASHGASVSRRQAQVRRAEAPNFLAIASALPKVRALRAEYPRSLEFLTQLPNGNRDVLFYQPNGNMPAKEIGQVVMDAHSGRVLEAWTGFQLAWTMARGHPGAFGRHVSALYVWLPLCLLFMLPFFNFRRPFSLLHLDLLVLLSLSVSLAFFNHGRIYASVPLAYPPLLYLLARMLVLARPDRRRRVAARSEDATVAIPPAPVLPRADSRSLFLLVPAPWLALGVLLLIGFRVALNVTDSNLTDVGGAGVTGAQRIIQGKPLYGSYPPGLEHADTYGPVNYEAYVPFEQIFGAGPSRKPAAQAAAIVFDLLAVALIFLLGCRVRGPTLGIALTYAWVSYPFTLFVLESNSNDALVAALVLAALLAATYRSKLAPPVRGAFAALAGLTKFAPLALAPLLATHGLRELPSARRPRVMALFVAGFLGIAALVSIPALSHSSLHTIYNETIGFQANRGSPFSVWGLYGGLGGLQLAVQIAAVLLAFALALVPRRADLVGLAAACAAVIIAMQLGLGYWFYLYIPWFYPLAILALLGRYSAAGWPQVVDASTSASWSE